MRASVTSAFTVNDEEPDLTVAYLRQRGLLRALPTLLGSFFFAYVNVGTPYPFLADALEGKGVDSVSTGAAYAMLPLGIAFAQLFTAPLERRYGTVKMHSAGFLLAGTCTLLMAFAFDITTDPTMLAVLVIGVRFLQGLGEGSIDNAIISMYQLNFSEVVGKVLGISEGATGLGLAVGPLLGGVLYKEGGGPHLPLFTTSSLCFVSAVVGPCFLRGVVTRDEVEGHDASILNCAVPSKKPYSDFVTAVVALGIFTANYQDGCQDPLYPIYLKSEFGWDEIVVGGIFAGGGVVYFISGLICGHLSDSNAARPRPSIYPTLAGSLLAGASFIAAGPFPGLPGSIGVKKALLISSVPIAAIGQALAVVHGMGVLTLTARSHSAASSVYSASMHLGMALGPLGGSLLDGAVGFRWTMAANVFLGVAVAGSGLFAKREMDRLSDDNEDHAMRSARSCSLQLNPLSLSPMACSRADDMALLTPASETFL